MSKKNAGYMFAGFVIAVPIIASATRGWWGLVFLFGLFSYLMLEEVL